MPQTQPKPTAEELRGEALRLTMEAIQSGLPAVLVDQPGVMDALVDSLPAEVKDRWRPALAAAHRSQAAEVFGGGA